MSVQSNHSLNLTETLKPLPLSIDISQNKNGSPKNYLSIQENLKSQLTDRPINIKSHPLNFYALGEVSDYKPQLTGFLPSRAFRGNSNDLIKRNINSLNSRYYDDLQRTQPKNKNFATIQEQNISENNYLLPINLYDSLHKYNLPSNCVNQATYNLAKKKLYASQKLSMVKNGKNITLKEFYEQKGKIFESEKEIINSNNNTERADKRDNINNTYDNSNKYKNYFSVDKKGIKNIKESNQEKRHNTIRKKIYGLMPLETETDINNKKNVTTDKIDNKSNNFLIFKNPDDPEQKKLKSNNFHFDRNNKQFLSIKNWWKVDK